MSILNDIINEKYVRCTENELIDNIQSCTDFYTISILEIYLSENRENIQKKIEWMTPIKVDSIISRLNRKKCSLFKTTTNEIYPDKGSNISVIVDNRDSSK